MGVGGGACTPPDMFLLFFGGGKPLAEKDNKFGSASDSESSSYATVQDREVFSSAFIEWCYVTC